MTGDDVKAANEALVESMIQQLRDCVSVGDEMTLDHACLIDDAADWISGEPARQAAAVAAAREEQARADMEAVNDALARGESWTPNLTATPLADEIAALRARVAYLEGELHETIGENADLVVRAERAEAERDALRAQVEAARTYARQSLDYGEDCDAHDLLKAMDEAKP